MKDALLKGMISAFIPMLIFVVYMLASGMDLLVEQGRLKGHREALNNASICIDKKDYDLLCWLQLEQDKI